MYVRPKLTFVVYFSFFFVHLPLREVVKNQNGFFTVRLTVRGGGAWGGRPQQTMSAFLPFSYIRVSFRERCVKNRKKLTNVSLVCMYVDRKSEMSVFFCFFSNRSNLSTISMVALEKNRKMSVFMEYVCM